MINNNPTQTSDSLFSSVSLDSARLDQENLTAYIRNTGSNPVTIDAVYIDNRKIDSSNMILSGPIQAKSVGTVIVQKPGGYKDGQSYEIKIITKDNAIVHWTEKAEAITSNTLIPVVSPGYDSGATTQAGIRYRSFGNTGGAEIYLGGPDIGNGAQRVSSNYNWFKPGVYQIEFSHDPSTGEIFTKVNGTMLSKSGYPGNGWDYLQIDVVERDAGTTVALRGVDVDGYGLGDFEGDGWKTWSVSNYDYSLGFNLTGRLIMEGPFGGSQELSKVQITVGIGS